MRVIELFKTITQIPRCSGTYQFFITFIQEFAQKHHYICSIDKANNILCYKKDTKATICLQSHYDIVCLKENQIPKIIELDGYLQAQDSTLGADNGIGCAYMLALMEEDYDCEFLFTCDEEVGLIGANNIEFSLKATKMLNLDSEMEGEICIGCAGGVDIFATSLKSQYIANEENKQIYEIEIDHLEGGHSGVDIDKNIPNAIKLLAKTIYQVKADLLDIQAGERINSIPKSAKAIIATNETVVISHPNMQITKVAQPSKHYKKLDPKIVEFLYSFSHGVRGYDNELGVVLSSINLAIVTNTIDGVKMSFSARSMEQELLDEIKDETIALLKSFGFKVNTDGKYPPWKPEKHSFTKEVLKIYQEYCKAASLNAIHAGLECAIFKKRYPNIDICSIGPNIYFPHSLREKCEISSVQKLFKVIKRIITNYHH